MLFLLMVPVVMFVATTLRLLQLYAPSNLIVARVRQARPRLWVAAALITLAAGLALCAAMASESAARGGPGWMHLIFLIAIYDAMKFAFMAIVVVMRCVVLAIREATGRTQPQGAS